MKKVLITGDQDFSLNNTIQKVMYKLLKNKDDYIFATYGSKYGADKMIQDILNSNYVYFFKFKSYQEK